MADVVGWYRECFIENVAVTSKEPYMEQVLWRVQNAPSLLGREYTYHWRTG
jgi:hypothetical protein